MSFIQRELDRLGRALRVPQTPESYAQLYAAQQALAWAMEPDGFASPFVAIARSSSEPLMGTQEDSGGCSHPPCQSPS
jgi:hypothetical protein